MNVDKTDQVLQTHGCSNKDEDGTCDVDMLLLCCHTLVASSGAPRILLGATNGGRSRRERLRGSHKSVKYGKFWEGGKWTYLRVQGLRRAIESGQACRGSAAVVREAALTTSYSTHFYKLLPYEMT